MAMVHLQFWNWSPGPPGSASVMCFSLFSDQEADMSFAPMARSAVRSTAQDFTQPFFYEYTTVAFKKPDQKAKVNLYVMPFKTNVRTMQSGLHTGQGMAFVHTSAI